MGAQVGEPREVFGPKDFAQRLDREQEAAATRAPLSALGTQATPCHHTVEVNMLGEILAPGMQYRRDAKLSPQRWVAKACLLCRARHSAAGRGNPPAWQGPPFLRPL